MGLREKVALTIAVIILIQIIFVTCSANSKTLKSDSSKQTQNRSLNSATDPSARKTLHPHVQGSKAISKKSSDKSLEAILKTFNFPDVEYPIASTPRPHFYLQETNILQRNNIQRPVENLSSKTDPYPMNINPKKKKYNSKKYNYPAKTKPTKNPEIEKTFPEFDFTPKPKFYREIGGFSEVEYPLNAWDTWKPNYWKEIPSYEPKTKGNNNELNSLSQVDTNTKLINGPSSKLSINSVPIPKSISSKKSDYVSTTPTPAETDTIESTNKLICTPYTILYFNTTPSYVDTRTDGNENTTPAPKKTIIKKKNKKKKKLPKKVTSLTLAEKDTRKDDGADNLNQSYTITTQQKELSINNAQESLFTAMSEECICNGNLNELHTCSNESNKAFSSTYITTSTPSHLSSDDTTSLSPFKIHNDDKVPTVSCDNKVTSISDGTNTIVSENTDNKDSYFDDNVRNGNKTSVCDVDEEFTTDVFPDFDENLLSISTSTVSPMSLVDIDENWANSIVIDPYKSVAYPDELDQYYIALP